MDKAARDKTRGKNFKECEVKLLLDLVEKHKDVVESKKTDVISSKDKDAAWEVITNEFNNLSGIYYRDAKTLRSKYDNMKKTTKRKYAEDKKYVMGTGGGAFVKTEFTETDIRIRNLLGDLQVMGQVSVFDSDAVEDPLSHQELEFASNSNINDDKPWDIANIPVLLEEEVVEEGREDQRRIIPLRRDIFGGFINQNSEMPKPDPVDVEGLKPTSSGKFNVADSPRKSKTLTTVSTKVTPARQPFPPFQLKDLRSKKSSHLSTNKKKKNVLDTSVAGKKIEAISTAKKEVMDLQRDLYEKQIQLLEEEHRLKVRLLEEDRLKKQRLLDLKIEREELELTLLKKK